VKLNPKEFALDRSRQVAPQILEILRSRILSMSLPPTTVLSRISLQSEFNVSQTPVRDALIRLEEEGLVEVYPQYATVVSRIDIRNATEAHFLRLSIELEAIRRLTLEAPDETSAALETVLSRQKRVVSPETYDLFDTLDKDFHRVLYEGQTFSVCGRQFGVREHISTGCGCSICRCRANWSRSSSIIRLSSMPFAWAIRRRPLPPCASISPAHYRSSI